MQRGTAVVVKNEGAIFNGKTGTVEGSDGQGFYKVTLDNGLEKVFPAESLEVLNPSTAAKQIATAKESGSGPKKNGGRKSRKGKSKKRITRKKRSTRRR